MGIFHNYYHICRRNVLYRVARNFYGVFVIKKKSVLLVLLAHRSIVWEYVLQLHVLNKKRNIINDLSGTIWKSQINSQQEKPKKKSLQKKSPSAKIYCHTVL